MYSLISGASPACTEGGSVPPYRACTAAKKPYEAWKQFLTIIFSHRQATSCFALRFQLPWTTYHFFWSLPWLGATCLAYIVVIWLVSEFRGLTPLPGYRPGFGIDHAPWSLDPSALIQILAGLVSTVWHQKLMAKPVSQSALYKRSDAFTQIGLVRGGYWPNTTFELSPKSATLFPRTYRSDCK